MKVASSEPLKEPLWTPQFILLSLANLFVFLGFQMLLPTLPLFVSEHGGTNTEVGLVIGLLTLSAVVIRPFAGAGLDKWGRKLILAIGVGICLLAMGGYMAAATVFMVLLLRFIHGIGWGIATTTFGVIASDMVPASRRGEGMGYFGLGSTLAMAIGPFVGLWIMNKYGSHILFAGTLISTLLSLVCMKFIAVPPQVGEAKQAPKESFVRRIVDKQAYYAVWQRSGT
jgi:MFS family permease